MQAIVDETGHCLSFYPPTGEEVPKPQRRGWREASTFSGFCDQHDGPTFRALETERFVASAEQVFLLAYRAECHELYQKQASVQSHDPMRQMSDRGKDPVMQRLIQEMLQTQQAGVEKGLDEARQNKARMDDELLHSQFGGLERLFVTFRGPATVVSTGGVTPNRTFSGREIQKLHDPKAALHRLYTAVVTEGDLSAVVFAWRNESAAIKQFVDELRALPTERIAPYIVQFLFAYIENSYFSTAWWETLSETHRAHIQNLACMGNPYYDNWTYVAELPIPWEQVEITATWPN